MSKSYTKTRFSADLLQIVPRMSMRRAAFRSSPRRHRQRLLPPANRCQAGREAAAARHRR
jgi:hypothetical protein